MFTTIISLVNDSCGCGAYESFREQTETLPLGARRSSLLAAAATTALAGGHNVCSHSKWPSGSCLSLSSVLSYFKNLTSLYHSGSGFCPLKVQLIVAKMLRLFFCGDVALDNDTPAAAAAGCKRMAETCRGILFHFNYEYFLFYFNSLKCTNTLNLAH